MRNLFLIIGTLVAYTLVYTGLSYLWSGVTVAPPGSAAGGSAGETPAEPPLNPPVTNA
jgi:hypothetical protein